MFLPAKENLGFSLKGSHLPQVFLRGGTVGLANEDLGGEFKVASASLALAAHYNLASKLPRVYYHMFHFPF